MYKFTDNLLTINDKEISLDYPIKQLIVYGNYFVILLDDEEMPNNIMAFNNDGIELWRINDILKIENPGNFTEIEKVSESVLGVYYVWGIYYEIDINTKETIKKEYTR